MKLAMCIAYQGTQYRGWQAQTDNLPTVQRMVERSLSQVANHPVVVCCAGRTDSGVHAAKQVIHFETTAQRDEFQWVMGANYFLPKDIRVLHAMIVDEAFNARFSAVERVYHYVIYNHRIPSVFLKDLTAFYHQTLCVESMQEASRVLIGEHDFSAFRGRDCQSLSPIRTMHAIEIYDTRSYDARSPVEILKDVRTKDGKEPEHRMCVPEKSQQVTGQNMQRNGYFIIISFRANAYLHHMVRNIVGSLLEVGLGKKSPRWIEEVLLSRDRRCAGRMAPAEGLYLADVIYPEPYSFPKAPFPFVF